MASGKRLSGNEDISITLTGLELFFETCSYSKGWRVKVQNLKDEALSLGFQTIVDAYQGNAAEYWNPRENSCTTCGVLVTVSFNFIK